MSRSGVKWFARRRTKLQDEQISPEPPHGKAGVAEAGSPQSATHGKACEPAHGASLLETEHIRRCHICDAVTVGQMKLVSRCGQCGKSLAPFYFFDEYAVGPLSENGNPLAESPKEGKRLPIRGLTAFW